MWNFYARITFIRKSIDPLNNNVLLDPAWLTHIRALLFHERFKILARFVQFKRKLFFIFLTLADLSLAGFFRFGLSTLQSGHLLCVCCLALFHLFGGFCMKNSHLTAESIDFVLQLVFFCG